MATNSETRELDLNELRDVSGGWLWTLVAGIEIFQFMESHHGLTDSINYIKQQAGK
jgi:hypothetical protein